MIQILDMSLFQPLPDLKCTRLKKRKAKNAQRILHIASSKKNAKNLEILWGILGT